MNVNCKFDEEILKISNLKWLPWIGPNYENKRIVLMGESHYDDGDDWLDEMDATRWFVQNQHPSIANVSVSRIFKTIEKTLLNQNESTLKERETIWNGVIYMNLVQRLLSSIEERPNDEDYENGWKVFLRLVEIVQPEIVIKFGYEGIGRLGYLMAHDNMGWSSNVDEFYEKPYMINLSKGETKVRIIFTHHPTGSRGFKYEVWNEHIKNYFPKIDEVFK